MTREEERARLSYEGGRPSSWSMGGVVQKAIAVAAGALLIASAIAVSVVLFIVLIAGALVGGTYLWWKTREVRKQMREATSEHVRPSGAPRGEVIEGEIISKSERDVGPRH
jgi:hypothetical protein